MQKYLVFCWCLICLIISILFLAAKRPEPAEALPVAKKTSAKLSEALFSSTQDSIPPVIVTPSSAGEVAFPHQQHYEDLEIECKTCHHEINAEKLKLPHEEYFKDYWIDCKICHLESGAAKMKSLACSKCHPSATTTIANETSSAKVVIHKQCWSCHEIGIGKEASTNCMLCHSGRKTEN